MKRTQVVVVGGGYAGTLAANRLRTRPDIAVTVVNPRPQFVERIRLHQYVAGTGPATLDYGTLLGTDIQLVVDSAQRIDAAQRTVTLATGRTLRYDYLVYAVGSSTAAPDFCHPLAGLEQAQRLRRRLEQLGLDAPVTVVGGGLTGIEAAAELAERGRPVTLVCGGALGPSLSGPGRRSAARCLTRLGVDIRESSRVVEVRPEAVRLDDGTALTGPVTVWTAGFAVPELAAASGLATDALGRLRTDETLTCIDHPRIVGAGDAVAPSDRPLRMSCQAAEPLGVQAANTVLSRVAGTAPVPLNQAFTGQCVSLGRRAGIVQFARRDDTPVTAFVGGRPAAAIKEAICKFTVAAIRREAAKPGSYRWLKGGRRSRPAELPAGQEVSA